MKQSLLLAFIVCFLSVQLANAQSCNSQRYIDTVFHNVTTTTDVYFGTATPYGLFAQPQDLYMDIYEPANDTVSKRPVIVYQFGGGFVIGWRTEPDIPAFCTYFAQLGYVVVTIDYRIGLNALDTNSSVRAFYRGVQDERSAIRYLCQNASQYKLDTNYIFLAGTSAGCFCGLANAFMTDADRPAETFGSTLEPDDLGCMDCSGNTDYGKRMPKLAGIINCWGAMLDTNLINPGENTPVVSFHGDQDPLVPYDYGFPFQVNVFPQVFGSHLIHKRLTTLGIRNELHPLVGYGHEPELTAPDLNDTIYNYSRKFLYPILQPNTSAITGDTLVCTGNSLVTYSVLATQGSEYCWQVNGGGTIASTSGNTAYIVWNSAGPASISVQELNEIGAAGEVQTLQVNVVASPQATFTDSVDWVNAYFANNSTNATSYTWLFGDSTSSSLINPSHTYGASGNYQVSLIAYNGVCSNTYTTPVVIDACPGAAFNSAISNVVDVAFQNNTMHANSYMWYFGNGDSSSATNPTETYNNSGRYGVTLIATNQYCSATFTDSVTIDICPVASFTYRFQNQFAFFNADTLNVVAYKWNFGDGDSVVQNVGGIIHQYAQPGIYTVILTVTDQFGCTDTSAQLVNLLTTVVENFEDAIKVNCDLNNTCSINLPGEASYNLQVFDLAGKLLVDQKISGNYVLPINNYPAGMYFMCISNSSGSSTRKFVKQ